MASRVLASLAVALPCFCAATEVTLGFDALTELASNVNSLGVTFAGATVLACGGQLNCGPYPPSSGRNVIYDTPGFGGVISATLDKAVTGNVRMVSARITGNRAISMVAFDDTGTVIGTKSTGGPNYVGSGSSIPANLKLQIDSPSKHIARVTFRDSGNTFTIDDFVYDGKPVAVLLDPGHGQLLANDGKKYYQRPATPTFRLREDNIVLDIASHAKDKLIEGGYANVYMTRSGSNAPYGKPCGVPDVARDVLDYCNEDLKLRVLQAKKLEFDEKKDTVFVSIHTNGGAGRAFYGRTQTFYCSDDALELAMGLQKAIERIAPPNFHPFSSVQNDCKERAVIVKTSALKIPQALLEVLYHNDASDEVELNKISFRTSAGSAIAGAIQQFVEEN